MLSSVLVSLDDLSASVSSMPVSDLLLLVIPGFITLRIKSVYGIEKQERKFFAILYCILYSFIVSAVYSAVVWIFGKIFSDFNPSSIPNAVKQISYFLLAVILGYVLVKFKGSRAERFVIRLFNRNLSHESVVWQKAMENKNGAWATVYLKNGMTYVGQLLNYTVDPDEVDKEILLYQYKLYVRQDLSSGNAEDFLHLVTDNTDEAHAKVLLNYRDILSIEIQP